jgi:glycosyltransferase involved in cell wall biosynthesis
MSIDTAREKVAVVLPCYRSKGQVLDVIGRIGSEVFLIIAVDDACPDGTGEYITSSCSDPRVIVVRNDVNLGVGGAVIRGYRIALEHGADIIVKIDSDGQMDPALLPQIVHPIRERLADYSKGNRFFNVEDVRGMPAVRVFGNAGLSLMTKLSSGYWNIFDPTNGYTSIHRAVLEMLPLEKIDRRFFFESDMLFRLYIAGAVVVDVPTPAVYAGEKSQLVIRRIVVPFFAKNIRNFMKRLFYRYLLRDMNIGSLEFVVGLLLLFFGTIFGLTQWALAASAGVAASAGTVMLAGLPILVGVQLVLGFFAYDFMAIPKVPLQVILGPYSTKKKKERVGNSQTP